MEHTTETEKKRQRSNQARSETDEIAIDWRGITFTVGSWLLQGAALAAGGALINRSLHAFSQDGQPKQAEQSADIVPLKRNISV